MIHNQILMVDYNRMRMIIEKTKFHTLNYVAKNTRFEFPAVYLIYSVDERLLYIGNTNSLKNRMEEHLHGIGRNNFCSKIKRRPEMLQDIGKYKIKYIRVDDFRERNFNECCLLAVYEPSLNFRR